MLNILKMATRNLARFGRRTLLTSTLITLGIVSVLLFVSVAGSFKAMMIGQFTDAVLGHLEVHRRGYVASIDTLPLNLNMQPAMVEKVEQALKASADDRGLLGARQARRHVQQFHRDHQHPHQRHRPGEGNRDDAAAARADHRGKQDGPAAEPRRDPDSGAAGPRHEGEDGRHRRAGRHQPRGIGQRQDLHRQGRTRERDRTERAGRLYPHRGRAGPAADDAARGQRDRHSPRGIPRSSIACTRSCRRN